MADLMEGLVVYPNGPTRRSSCDALSSTRICVKVLAGSSIQASQSDVGAAFIDKDQFARIKDLGLLAALLHDLLPSVHEAP